MVICSFVVNLQKLSKLYYSRRSNFQMLGDVSTDNGSLFHKEESVIFYDDYVQYDNSSLFFRAVIDCWMYSMVHSVLVDSCKII